LKKSLQQRACSGFAPDSLFNASSEPEKHHQNRDKDNENLSEIFQINDGFLFHLNFNEQMQL
jgi:hypothetical protein